MVKQYLEDIREVSLKIESWPTVKEYREHGEFTYGQIREHFDSWYEAVKQAGVEYEMDLPDKISPDDQLEGAKSGGRVSTPSGDRKPVTEQDILSDILRVANDIGFTPLRAEYDKFGNYTSQTVCDKFGQWENAIRSAGLPPIEKGKIPSERLLLDLMRVAKKIDGPPSKSQYDEKGQFSSQTIRNRFPQPFPIISREAYQMIFAFSDMNEFEASGKSVDELLGYPDLAEE